jgi:hypothetical protein
MPSGADCVRVMDRMTFLPRVKVASPGLHLIVTCPRLVVVLVVVVRMMEKVTVLAVNGLIL